MHAAPLQVEGCISTVTHVEMQLMHAEGRGGDDRGGEREGKRQRERERERERDFSGSDRDNTMLSGFEGDRGVWGAGEGGGSVLGPGGRALSAAVSVCIVGPAAVKLL